ncbi:MAG: hypothetical protein O2923_06505 [Verrucomicrobia bacterium]|nr:hypothetical protein [Verrucomicrobiota bacterium]
MSPAQAEEFAMQAQDIAARQNRLAEEMEALTGANEKELLEMRDQHLAERLSGIADDTRAVVRGAAELMPQNGSLQALKDQSLARISQADQIADAMMESADDGGTAPPPVGNLPQTLAEASSFIQGLGQSIPTQPVDSETPESAKAMAAAYQAVSQAAVAPGGNQKSAAHAASSMAQAAQQASQAAMAMGLNPGGVSATGGGADGFTHEVPDGALLEIGISRSDWMRLPGELRDEILQAAAEEGPQEYRPLIKRYFRDIATRSMWSRRNRGQK